MNNEDIFQANAYTDKRNSFLRRSFFTAIGLGIAVAMVNMPVRLGQMFDMGAWSDLAQNSNVLKYISNHVKGTGQILAYSQATNLALSEANTLLQENKNRSKDGINIIQPTKDFSAYAGLGWLGAAFAWEKLNQSTHAAHVFDTPDMLCYGAGTALFLAWNYATNKAADIKFPVKNIEDQSFIDKHAPRL